MIRIDKPTEAPEILRTRGAQRRATHCRNFTRHEPDYRNGSRTFPFDQSIYGHESVKQALMLAQHRKCCFCESRIGSDGDVEHFRPKAACCQGENDPLLRPGYYWLTYDWDNLLLSCGPCNQRHKRNLFPLVDTTLRATSHRGDASREDPLFIDPTRRDPEQYISFRREIAYPIDDNPYGIATIGALRLNRENLNERRRDCLNQLKTILFVLKNAGNLKDKPEGPEVLEKARQYLAHIEDGSAEFAGLLRAALRSEAG